MRPNPLTPCVWDGICATVNVWVLAPVFAPIAAIMFDRVSGVTVIGTSNAPNAIEREHHVIEIPQTVYRHNGFTDGELVARLEDGALIVRVATIDGDTTIRIPMQHLEAICDIVAFVRDDQ